MLNGEHPAQYGPEEPLKDGILDQSLVRQLRCLDHSDCQCPGRVGNTVGIVTFTGNKSVAG
jgi:hypothetical protein